MRSCAARASGRTARAMARFRPHAELLGMSPDPPPCGRSRCRGASPRCRSTRTTPPTSWSGTRSRRPRRASSSTPATRAGAGRRAGRPADAATDVLRIVKLTRSRQCWRSTLNVTPDTLHVAEAPAIGSRLLADPVGAVLQLAALAPDVDRSGDQQARRRELGQVADEHLGEQRGEDHHGDHDDEPERTAASAVMASTIETIGVAGRRGAAFTYHRA